jgi:hypothetical protein
MTTTAFIGLIAVFIGLISGGLYILSVLRKESKPHLFTWIIWGLISAIAYVAQLHDHAGPGSWAMGLTALSCAATMALCFKYGEKNITRSDWIALIASLSAIIPWIMTDDPLYSVILVSIIDIVAFYPTFRKSWHKPHEENLLSYNIASLKLVLSLFALDNFTVTTSLYAITIVAANTVFAMMCYTRRKFSRCL